MIKDTELMLRYVDGESFLKHCPKFSMDSQFIFLATLRRLFSYTVKTGKRFVEFKGMEGEIVNYGLYYEDSIEYMVACTTGGNITCWKTSNGLKLKHIKIGVDYVKFFEVFETFGRNYMFLAWSNAQNKVLQTGLIPLDTFELCVLGMNYRSIKKCKFAIGGYNHNLHHEDNQTIVAYIAGNVMCIDYLFKQDVEQVQIRLAGRRFTVIATHPSELAILTGDNTGRIVLWQNLFGQYTQAVFHWHTLPVKAVCFSAFGSNFFSGADECVLVKWTADDAMQKKFLPRMSNCIRRLAIAPENLCLAVTTLDNAIHIVDMQCNVVSVLQELILGDEFPAGLHLDPKTRSLVVNGTVGHLQFYSPHNRQLLYNLDVAGINRITNERGLRIQNTNIKVFDISKNGLWMATVEEREDTDEFIESRLKFWSFNETEQNFQLNTNVEYAHEGKIVNVKFQPSNAEDLRLVSIGNDGFFKVWQLVDVTSVYTKGFSWRCASSGFYRDLIPTSLAFSYDGSLLAVGFRNILTTWLPESIALKCSLLHPTYYERIAHMAFGTNTQCHLVVVASRKRLCVWNLLTLCMIWTVPLRVKFLVTDPTSTHMGVITKYNKLFIFEPISETPLYQRDDLVNEGKMIMAAIMVPTGHVHTHRRQQAWHDKTQLYIIDSNKELHCFGSSLYDDTLLDPMHFLLTESQARSAFSHLKPALKSGGEKATHTIHSFAQKMSKPKLDDLLEGSIHTMVPMRMIAHSIINAMIYKKPRTDFRDKAKEHAIKVQQYSELVKNNEVQKITEDLSEIVLEPVTWTSIFTSSN